MSSATSVQTAGLAAAPAFYAGSGGGPSLRWLQPGYQAGAVPAADANSTTERLEDGTLAAAEILGGPVRVTPDIAMVADPYTGFTVGETYTTAAGAEGNTGCTPLAAATEYCFGPVGGTSLSTPLFAGVLALVDQARIYARKSAVGFVNPALYGMPVGQPGTTGAPLTDVVPPATPTAVLRGYVGAPWNVRLVTMNSALNAAGTAVVEGADTTYTTAPGFDEVTGLGTPNVPALIAAFNALP